MILRSLTKHLESQNWLAVLLDFLIVVIGVFVGLQVTNWNEVQGDIDALQEAKERLGDESIHIQNQAADISRTIRDRLNKVQAAIVSLETCRTGEDAVSSVNRGLNMIRAGLGVGAQSDALDLIVSDERLLRLQAKEERAILRSYAGALEEISETSIYVLRTATPADVDKHPLVGFSEVVDPATTVNGIDVRIARVTHPLAEACKDQSFLKLFYRWERAHVYQLGIARRLSDTVATNNSALGLPLPSSNTEQ